MSSNLLDIYSDYLICQNKYATATGLSDMLSGDISHDKITKYLNSVDLGSKELWEYNKREITKHQTGIVSLPRIAPIFWNLGATIALRHTK